MNSESVRILAVAEDPALGWALQEAFPGGGHQIESLISFEDALNRVRDLQPQLILLDFEAPGCRGLETVARFKGTYREGALVLVSESSDPNERAEALRVGAEDFLTKPINSEILEICLRKVIEKKRLREQVSQLQTELARDHAMAHLVGESSRMLRVRETIEQVATTDLNILIRGESGTGKDITARLIHQLSSNREGPFVKVNCAALPENLIEAELFGYEKGAFTGAIRSKPGRFQLAHGGTIFLDEITEIPYPLQSKLLQVLEQREFVRVGGTKNTKVDCRCVAATNADMEFEMKSKGFREDLFFRLNEFAILLPPLRERREDIPLLIDHFLSLYSERYLRERRDLPRETVHLMMEYPWPGNVRELESLIKRALVLDSDEVILQTIGAPSPPVSEPWEASGSARSRPAATLAPPSWETRKERGSVVAEKPVVRVPLAIEGGARSQPVSTPTALGAEAEDFPSGPLTGDLKTVVDQAVEKAERAAILHALRHTRWNRRRAAKNLGISYSSLLRRIAKYSLDVE